MTELRSLALAAACELGRDDSPVALDSRRVNRDTPSTDGIAFFDHCETVSDRHTTASRNSGGGIAIQHRNGIPKGSTSSSARPCRAEGARPHIQRM